MRTRLRSPKKAEEILAQLRQVKAFHLMATEANEDYWRQGGIDIDWL